MQRTLNQLLKDAGERKPRRLSFDITYSHDNFYDCFCKFGRSEGLYVHVGVVEFPIDLARFDLVQGELLLDAVEDHQEVLTFFFIIPSHCWPL
jgi:hypothetical protein